MRLILLLTLMFASFSLGAATQPATRPAGASQTRHEAPQVHQFQAGVPGRDGWCDAESTGGRFSVSMPRKFNDMSVSQRQDDGTTVRTHVVAATFENGTRFVASASSNASVKLAPHAAADYVDLLVAKGVATRNRRAVKMDGVEATEIEVVHMRTVARHRVAQCDNVIYVMTIERPGEDFPKEAEQIATRFFESFRLPTPESDIAPAKTVTAPRPLPAAVLLP